MNELQLTKVSIRQACRRRRAQLTDRTWREAQIINHLTRLPLWQLARQPLIYVSCRDEVGTHSLIQERLQRGEPVWIPYCEESHLRVFQLQSWDQLISGRFGVLEPRPELRATSASQGEYAELDVVVTPGVAFDRLGNRLGYGAGFFDRLLAQCIDAVPIGLAFDCQIVNQVPVESHDRQLDLVLTESRSLGRLAECPG